jgi:glycosyltransferase involved in cell wall biosynthesis
MTDESEHNTEEAVKAHEADPLRSGDARLATVLQVLPAMEEGGGGVERGTVEIAEAITEAGGRALVVSAGGRLTHELTRVKAEHIELPMASKNPFVMYNNIARLAHIIQAHDVDIVHARSRAPAWSAYFAARRTGVHFVTTFHGTYGIGNPLKRRYNAVMTKGERVIAISGFIAGHIRQHYGVPSSKIRIIHRGVDLNRFSPKKVTAERVIKLANEWRLAEGLPIVMLPGRLTRWKGHVTFIEAVAALKRRDIRCLIVGSDQGRTEYRRELEGLIEKHDLGEVMRLVDYCDDMPAAYMLSDAVVSASTDPEAFGRVVAEAQALGRLVIGPDHGGARELIIEDETGWLTPPGDSAALAEAIEKALSFDTAARNRAAARAIVNIRRHFLKQSMCTKTLDVYNEVLQIGPQSGT